MAASRGRSGKLVPKRAKAPSLLTRRMASGEVASMAKTPPGGVLMWRSAAHSLRAACCSGDAVFGSTGGKRLAIRRSLPGRLPRRFAWVIEPLFGTPRPLRGSNPHPPDKTPPPIFGGGGVSEHPPFSYQEKGGLGGEEVRARAAWSVSGRERAGFAAPGVPGGAADGAAGEQLQVRAG